MPWIDSSLMYSALLGGLIGGSITAWSYRYAQRCNMRVLEIYWQNDIKKLRSRISELEGMISTNSADNSVVNV